MFTYHALSEFPTSTLFNVIFYQVVWNTYISYYKVKITIINFIFFSFKHLKLKLELALPTLLLELRLAKLALLPLLALPLTNSV